MSRAHARHWASEITVDGSRFWAFAQPTAPMTVAATNIRKTLRRSNMT